MITIPAMADGGWAVLATDEFFRAAGWEPVDGAVREYATRGPNGRWIGVGVCDVAGPADAPENNGITDMGSAPYIAVYDERPNDDGAEPVAVRHERTMALVAARLAAEFGYGVNDERYLLLPRPFHVPLRTPKLPPGN